LGGVRSAKGLTLAPPGNETNVVFVSEFEVGSTTDTTSPEVIGTNLELYRDSQGNIVNVPVGGIIEIGFSEIINPSTFNTNTVTLKAGTVEVSGTASYDPVEGIGRFVPDSALSPNTTYTLTLSSEIKDLADNSLTQATYTFTTGAGDNEPPKVVFANCDDYSCAITFSEPMNAAPPSDTIKGASSVLNPKNYVLWIDDFAPWEPFKHLVKYYNCDNLAGANCDEGANVNSLVFSYEPEKKTVIIKGFNLSQPVPGVDFNGGFRIWVRDVADLSGNTINDNSDYKIL